MSVSELAIYGEKYEGDPGNLTLYDLPLVTKWIGQASSSLVQFYAGNIGQLADPSAEDALTGHISAMKDFKLFHQNPALTMATIGLAFMPKIISMVAGHNGFLTAVAKKEGDFINHVGESGTTSVQSITLATQEPGFNKIPMQFTLGEGEGYQEYDGVIDSIDPNDTISALAGLIQSVISPMMTTVINRGQRLLWAKAYIDHEYPGNPLNKFTIFAIDQLQHAVSISGEIRQ